MARNETAHKEMAELFADVLNGEITKKDITPQQLKSMAAFGLPHALGKAAKSPTKKAPPKRGK